MITVVGIGPGVSEYMAPAALKAIKEAEILVGGERALGLFSHLGKKTIGLKHSSIKDVISYLKANGEKKKIAVLVSGDPGLFSFLNILKKELPPAKLKVIPGISSAQLLFARLSETWDDVRFFSLHGQESQELPVALKQSRKICLFTDMQTSFSKLARMLRTSGLHAEVVIGQNLGLEDERLIKTDVDGLETLAPTGLSIVYIRRI